MLLAGVTILPRVTTIPQATVRSNMDTAKTEVMPDKAYRALLTDREREILTGQADVDEKYYYRVVTRVRRKIDRLDDDVAALDHHDSLGDELRAIVCEDSQESDISAENETY